MDGTRPVTGFTISSGLHLIRSSHEDLSRTTFSLLFSVDRYVGKWVTYIWLVDDTYTVRSIVTSMLSIVLFLKTWNVHHLL